MTQLSFSDAEHAGKRKQTRREVPLAEMEQVVPWPALPEVSLTRNFTIFTIKLQN